MIRNILFILIFLAVSIEAIAQNSQMVIAKRDPKLDYNLSPKHNLKINPEHNSLINPKFNWNINPAQNKAINPKETTNIHPLHNTNLNPKVIDVYNPMFANLLHPRHPNWEGKYFFDSLDNVVGFISVASQNILLCFDKKGEWTCYFVKTSKGTYNQYKLDGEWTGRYLCYDSCEGYNLFNEEGAWTGSHVK